MASIVLARYHGTNQKERGTTMAMNAAEKRAELEKRLGKLTETDLAAKIAEQKSKLEEEINRLSGYKEYEGRVALWDMAGDKSCMVRVIVNGFARKAFRRELFNVSPLEGSGSVNVALEKLEFEPEEAPTAGKSA